MKFNAKTFLICVISLMTLLSKAETPLWLRGNAISPDGKTIAFSYKGNIFTVNANGGNASQLTYDSSYDNTPIWSPDGKWIAFSSNRNGHMDIYVIPANGGNSRKITKGAANKYPITFRDENTILYSANENPSTSSMQFPSGTFSQVYEVRVDGKKDGLLDRMVSSMPMRHISISKDGSSWLYYDKKGMEDNFRKHHTSSVTCDVWLWNKNSNKYTKLTTFKGEDREPVWGDGNTFYYLSEENGSFNVYRRNINESTSVAMTNFKNHPVRSLSRSENGVLCFSYNGELYTMQENGKPEKVMVNLVTDNTDKELIRRTITSGASDFSVSPNGKEIAFILHGDVYVTSVDYETTRQITDTPEQERNVDFSPDGKSVVYDSERDGLWQIYMTQNDDDNSKTLLRSKSLVEKRLTNNNVTSFQPAFSPDGKYIAYLENRTALVVMNLKNGKTQVAQDGKYSYSYTDGDQTFCWSPDSKWLLTDHIGIGGWNNKDIALVKADGSESYNLTQSGYSDVNPKWVLDGKAMVWSSDRAGYRSHGSWGAERDYYIMFFDIEAYDKFKMSKEELELIEDEKTDKEKKKEEKEKKEEEKDKNEEKIEKVKDLVFDLTNLEHRIIRLTKSSSHLGDAILDKKGENFYYAANMGNTLDLWKHDLKNGDVTKMVDNIGGSSFVMDKKQENVYFLKGGKVNKMAVGSKDYKAISFAATQNFRPAQEREYIFEHCWRLVKDKFYDTSIHNVDWQMYHDNYKRFLPHINNNYDFTQMLSEMLGELNASHTGSGYYHQSNELVSGRLGVFYDDEYTGKGLKIKEIIDRSPLKSKKAEIEEGMIITHIDNVEITDSLDRDYLLAGKVGKNVTLTIAKKEGGKTFDVNVKTISKSEENELLYYRWVERNKKIVENKTNGKIGYIHIKSMNSQSFRTLYSDLLGKYRNCDAVIIDTRHNGGGWLHDDVITLLSAKEYARYVPRGQYIGSDPYNKFTKKSCMLICEDNYSNAHGTPWLYKELGVGKLIGAPVPGTMTAVWWETQIDNSIYFGIPQVGCMDMRGEYLENKELKPDIEVYNDPADFMNGKDAQLDAAIYEMMKETGNLDAQK